MLPFVLLPAAALLLIWAIRGRITAHGTFCRKCRFDLAGLGSPATCPECGRDLSQPKATRPTLRHTNKPALIAALLCFLIAIPSLLTGSSAVRAWMLPRTSDSVLAVLDRLDLDGAHEEVIARLSDPATHRPAFAATISRALDRVLSQGVNAPSEDRAIILAALRGAQLNEPQAERYFNAVVDTRITIREKAYPSQIAVPSAWMMDIQFQQYFLADEMYSGPPPAYALTVDFHRGGSVATNLTPPDLFEYADRRAIRFIGNRFAQPAQTTPFRNFVDPEPPPGDSVFVHAGLVVRIHSPRSTEPVLTIWRTARQTVAIIPPDQPLVPVNDNRAALEQLASTLRMRECGVLDADEVPLLVAHAVSDTPSPAHAIFRATLESGDLRLISDDPVPYAPHLFPAGSQSHGQLVFQAVLRAPTDRDRFNALPPDAVADITLRPDPRAVYLHAEIESYLLGEIIFRNIPFRPLPMTSPPEHQVWHKAEAIYPLPAENTPSTPEP